MSCTAAELADLIGVSPRSITDLAKRGIVVRAKRGFDEHKSVRGYCDHLRKLRLDAAVSRPLPVRQQNALG